MDYRNCRFCGNYTSEEKLVHYSTRCYAHPVCLFQKKGVAALEALHPHQIDALPVLLLIRAGFATEETALDRLTAMRQAAVDREEAARKASVLRFGLHDFLVVQHGKTVT